MLRIFTLLICAGILLLQGCSSSKMKPPKQLQQTTASVIQIKDPWVRAVPPNANNSAIFLDLQNESEQLRKLVEVHSEVAERVELHMTKDEEGMLRKQRLEEVLIPALETQSFHPGGIHIMLIGLHSPLEVGRVIKLELVYADQSKETISVPVMSAHCYPSPPKTTILRIH